MKSTIYTIIFFTLFNCSANSVINKVPSFEETFKAICGVFNITNSSKGYDECLNVTSSLNPVRRSIEIRDYFDEINSKYEKYLNLINILESRVSVNQSNYTVNSSQSLHSLEIGESGKLIITEEINLNITDTINLDQSISLSTNWTTHEVLDTIVNETISLKQCIDSYEPIVTNEIVWIDQNVIINGSCCLIANVTLGPGQQIYSQDLMTINDTDGTFHDSEFTWGFIMNGDQGLNFNISNQIIFNETLISTVIETPSIDLTNSFRNEYEPIHITGNLSFNQLELKNVTINKEDENHPYSLLSTVNIIDRQEVDLCHITFNQVNLSSLIGTKLSGIDLADLLTTNTNQSSNAKEIALKEIHLNGSTLTNDHGFAVKMVEKLTEFIVMDNFLYYDNLILDTINVTNLNTSTWDDFMVNNLNETYNLDNVHINGTVLFDYVNDIKYDHDLVTLNGSETIKSNIVFEDEVLISFDLANRLWDKNEITMDNWQIEGDLIITDQLNDMDLGEFVGDLIPYNNLTKVELRFAEKVEASNCNFETIDQVDFTNFMKIKNISELLTINDLQVNNLTLDQVNVPSCLRETDQLDSDEDTPIDQLNIMSLEANGTINTIESSKFLVNCSDQDFTQSRGSIDVNADISFKHLVAANCSTPNLNGIDLNRLLRADSKLKWPETMILKSSNITGLTNPELFRKFSNLLLTNSNQTIDVDLEFHELVEFMESISFYNNELGINLWMDIGKDGDICWDQLEINGNLTVRKLFELDGMTNITINKGAIMKEGLEIREIISTEGDLNIYSESEWKVYQRSTINSSTNLTINNLTIENDLTITNQEILPWMKNGSLDGIEHYHDITLDNLTVNLNSNMEYNKFTSNLSEIKLEDVADLNSDQFDLNFGGELEVKGNVTSNSDVDLNLVKMYDE